MELFPGSIHVFETGLARFTSDRTIWEYAKAHNFTIVTADSDFVYLASTYGTPPCIIRLENGNYRTDRVEELIRRNAIRIVGLLDVAVAVLVIRNFA